MTSGICCRVLGSTVDTCARQLEAVWTNFPHEGERRTSVRSSLCRCRHLECHSGGVYRQESASERLALDVLSSGGEMQSSRAPSGHTWSSLALHAFHQYVRLSWLVRWRECECPRLLEHRCGPGYFLLCGRAVFRGSQDSAGFRTHFRRYTCETTRSSLLGVINRSVTVVVSAVNDQSQCGSCGMFSATEAWNLRWCLLRVKPARISLLCRSRVACRSPARTAVMVEMASGLRVPAST